MLRALVWKELREHRWTLVGFCFCLFILMPYLPYIAEVREIDRIPEHVRLVLHVLMIYAAFLGAHTFAYEREQGTLVFLLTRPMGRVAVAGVKILTCVSLLALGELFAALLVIHSGGIEAIGQPGMAFGWCTAPLLSMASCTAASSVCHSFFGALILGGSLWAALGLLFVKLSLHLEAAVPANLLVTTGLILLTLRIVRGAPLSGWRTQARASIKTLAATTAFSFVALYIWSLYLTAFPGPMHAKTIRVTRQGLIISAETVNPPLGGQPQERSYRVNLNGAATWWPRLRNTGILGISPDERFLIVSDSAGFLGFQKDQAREYVLQVGDRPGGRPHTAFRENGLDSWSGWCFSGNKLAFFRPLAGETFSPVDSDKKCILSIMSLPSGDVMSVPFEPPQRDSRSSWRILSFNDQTGTLLLLQRPEAAEDTGIVVNVDLRGKVVSEYRPFDHPGWPDLMSTLASGTLVLQQGTKEDYERKEIVLWKPGHDPARVTLPPKWELNSVSSDGDWWVIERSRYLHATKGRRSRTRSLALVNVLASRFSPGQRISVPPPNDLFYEKTEAIPASETCHPHLDTKWSGKDRAFLCLIDPTKIQSISPRDRILKDHLTIRYEEPPSTGL